MGVRAEIGFIAPLDGMRAVAVSWVVLFHYAVVREKADPWVAALAEARWLEAVVRNGYLGVDLFFLISGFLLTLPWLVRAHDGRPAPGVREFYLRRVRRIVPAYYVHLVLLFALFVPVVRGWSYLRQDAYVVAWNALAHAGFLHTTTPLTSGSLAVNGALWTLAVEAHYYVLVPLLAAAFVRTPMTAAVLAFIAAALWQHGARHGFEPLVAAQLRLGSHWSWSEATVRHLLLTQMPAYLGHFAFGTVLGRAWLAWRRSPPPFGGGLLAAMSIAGAAALLQVLVSGRPVWGEQTWILTTLALGALLFSAAAASGPFARHVLGRGPMAFVGRVSYSAYLYHLPLLLVWTKYVPVPGALSLPLYLALVLFVAWVSWRFVEQRFLAEPKLKH